MKQLRKHIIGLYGAAGTGKTTLATAYGMRQYLSFGVNIQHFSFATPLKDIGEQVVRLLGGGDMPAQKDKRLHVTDRAMTYRDVLIEVGTLLRSMKEDVFIQDLYRRSGGFCRPSIIDDVRNKNEADFIRSEGGFIVEVVADGYGVTDSIEQVHPDFQIKRADPETMAMELHYNMRGWLDGR